MQCYPCVHCDVSPLHLTKILVDLFTKFLQLSNGIRPRAPFGMVSKFLSSFGMIGSSIKIYCNYNNFLIKYRIKDIRAILVNAFFNADIVSEKFDNV